MASTLRLSSSAFRSTLVKKPVVQSAAFNGLRCYSSAKAKVCDNRFMKLLSLPNCILTWSYLVPQGDVRREAAW